MPNKKISELPDNTTPLGSDIFPLVNSGITKQQSLSGLTSFFGGSEKVYFYEINYNGSRHIPISNPIGISGFNSVQNARTTAPYLFEAFEKTHIDMTGGTYNVNFYDNMLFEIIEENGINVDGLQFPSLTGLSEYLTANLTANVDNMVDNYFTVKMYGLKKNTYQKLNKIRGVNTFFANLRGRGSYWRQTVQLSHGDFDHVKLNCLYSSTQSGMYRESKILNDFLKSIYLKFLGYDYTDYNKDDVMKTIWFNNDRKRYYNLYPISAVGAGPVAKISLGDCAGNRRMIDSIGDFVSAGVAPDRIVASSIFLLDKTGQFFIYSNGNQFRDGFKLGTNDIDIELEITLPIYSNAGFFQQKGDDVLANMVSAIRVYHVQDGFGNSSFVVKPMGIDTLLIDYIEDNTDAILYGLFSSNEDGRQTVVKFDDNTKQLRKTGDVTWRINLGDYELFTLDKVRSSTNFRASKVRFDIGRYSKNNFKDFRFFYGYPDGTISPLSDDEVYHIVNSNGCPLKRLIRKNPIN